MNWDAVRSAFEDEMEKIAISLSGLSPETLVNYPQSQPMNTPGLEQAKKVLDRYQPLQQKTAGIGMLGPDELPQINRLFRKRNRREEPPPSKVDSALSVGGHTLAGAGVGRFLHGAAETVAQSRRTGDARFHKLDPKYQVAAVGGGAALGLANKLRKEHRKKKFQQGKMKTSSPASPTSTPGGPTIKGTLGKTLVGFKGRLPSPAKSL